MQALTPNQLGFDLSGGNDGQGVSTGLSQDDRCLAIKREPTMEMQILQLPHISENWNEFVKWAAFGGEGIIRHNNREEQRKVIRYNHLVANLVVFHNVVSMTRIFQDLVDEGYSITPEIIANFSPYRTEHLNRFGSYDVRFDQQPPPIIEALRLSPDLAVRVN